MPYCLLEKMAVTGFINGTELSDGDVITGHVHRSPVEVHVDGNQKAHVNDVEKIGTEGSVVFDRRFSPFPSRRIVFLDGREYERFRDGLSAGSVRGMQLTFGRAWEKAEGQFRAQAEK